MTVKRGVGAVVEVVDVAKSAVGLSRAGVLGTVRCAVRVVKIIAGDRSPRPNGK